MRRGLIFADRHLSALEELHPSYQLVKEFAKDFKPDFAVDLGDSLHLDYFSKFEEGNDIEGDWEDDVDLLNQELDFWQGLVGKEYVWIQGNHDERAERAAKKIQNTAFKKSIDYNRRFHIKERGIKYFRTIDPPPKIGKLHFIHGWFWNKYCAWTHLDRFSGNIAFGHVHIFQQFSKQLVAKGEEVQAWSIACLCDKQPDYVHGRPTGWQHGFAVTYIKDNGDFNLYPINIIKNSFLWEGREWKV